MSTTTDRPLAPDDRPPPDDPFLFGWRDVRRVRADGTTYTEQVPLTRFDVLHPQEGDTVVESDLHHVLRTYLDGVFRARLADVPGALVLSDTGIYWDVPELSPHSPDLAAIFDVKETRAEWTSFDVAEQGTRPLLIVELVSPHVRTNDVVDKVDHYYRVGVPHYVIADRRRVGGDWSLIGYARQPDGYRRVPPNDRGWQWLPGPDVWLAAEGPRLVCYDPSTGQPFSDYLQLGRELEQEKGRTAAAAAHAEAARVQAARDAEARAAAETRLRELEAELARLRGQSPP